MSYSEDSVRAKLSSLNDTQESIVTVAQWIMFHRRYADRTAQLWLQKLKDSLAPKRLSLVYLANEAIQQTKARKKDDFVIAFAPIIAEAIATAYKGASEALQEKLRRVVDVWRQRQIFDSPILEAVENRIKDIDKSLKSGKKPLMGGSLFSNSGGPLAPLELQPLVPLQIQVSKLALSVSSAMTTANVDYDKLMDPNLAVPNPPVHAARLTTLLKTLANAEGAVSESIKAHEALISGLEQLLSTNRATLDVEKGQHFEFQSRKTSTELKKREIEDNIMHGTAVPKAEAANSNGGHQELELDEDTERPQVEELTPPPQEALTPIGSPRRPEDALATTSTGADRLQELPTNHDEPAPAAYFQPANSVASSNVQSSYAMPGMRRPSYGGHTTNGGYSSAKKRKMEGDFGGFAGGDVLEDLDADVAELLRAESGGR